MPHTSELDARIAALETRIAALEDAYNAEHPAAPTTGTIEFSGDVELPIGHISYQRVRPAAALTDAAWNESLNRISALSHPIRTDIIRHLLQQPASVMELVNEKVVTSAGTAYHHISTLESAGWVAKKRGIYSIPDSRIVPLRGLVAWV
ncbi:winged helix-turn-helix domain-containing protein [Corynebacterium sp.]|uniref:winged helix-turn-helix domain-containing protein n=1 Tax=Corynebacterium sp. TaxID=1720 RepID=UPI0026DD5A3D|nr:winged helix-turn-helix domain-containing protein [Corynebacterium sp.]MDO5076631.1 winged helix-turn-helix domain-containing protein [Corynebacterium sp.]